MSKKPFNFFAGDAKKHTQESTRTNGTTAASSSSSSKTRNTVPENVPSPSLPSQSNGSLRTSIMEAIRTISNSDPALIESFKQSILELLLSERSIDAIQEDLFNALGVENFELISEILTQRDQVIQVLVDSSDGSNAAGEQYDNTRQSTPILDYEEDDGNPMSNFIVQTKSQSKQRKENRKDQKRAYREVNKVIAGLGETDKLEYQLALKEHQRRMERQFTEVEWTTNGLATRPRQLPYVFDAFEAAGLKSISVDSTKMCLPEGTEFKKTKEYEEIRVPPTSQTIPIEVKRIQVKDLDPLGKLGFEGFKELNIIQSIVFEQAYHTLENLLICAPTGAGKTNIAMLAVLKTIRDHCKPDGTIDKNDFKIIYIAPMKALAAEMTENFSKRLSKLGLKVKELTGDTTLTKKEIAETQMLVLTPEKWDVVTRKADDEELTSLVRLLIIDEVHLLHDERGPVIETIVARTRRRIQMAQHKVRIVGLSATLPNYIDVATFLDINPEKGLFFFDGRFRPVPLAQTFIGVGQSLDRTQQGQQKLFDDVCYENVLKYVEQYHQVLVFVHTRNGTHKIAKYMLEKAANQGQLEAFLPSNITIQPYLKAKKQILNLKNRELEQLFLNGLGVHHAGMIRYHRSTVERLFAEGHIRVLCCTATLAWGVNLPAHAVIIRGTEVFDQQKGVFTDIGVLDVQQIFGRAGRPQFETSGEGVIITNKSKLIKYVTMLIRQAPIESQYMKRIHDNLNAEIAAGII
uniref:Activating signal cointegrator 1 complex subunit 3 n=1 Tax=Panagrolaimus superbus TaxID=310955 RepID=A0A914YTQ4_9BILA